MTAIPQDQPCPPDRDEIDFWRERVGRAIAAAGTPCHVLAAEPMAGRLADLDRAFHGLPVRSWWSFKTLPVARPVAWWRDLGHPVEVVSAFELEAAHTLGFPPDRILVNGPAKHAWLESLARPGLRVNFDSVAEIEALAAVARRQRWQIGVRLNTSSQTNFEYPGLRDQFGLIPDEIPAAALNLKKAQLEVQVLHLHLRTHVQDAECYRSAAEEALASAAGAGWKPPILDLGGGFPATRVLARRGTRLDAGFSLRAMRTVIQSLLKNHRLTEIWLEVGRWLTAPAGALAVRVLDVKEGRGARTLICDGGRTLHALVATWERHALTPLRPDPGPSVPTLVCGPTCMAFDNLGLHDLPSALRTGDVLIWWDAGAYQIGWETRFSHGLAPIVWTEGGETEILRPTEPFRSWWLTR